MRWNIRSSSLHAGFLHLWQWGWSHPCLYLQYQTHRHPRHLQCACTNQLCSSYLRILLRVSRVDCSAHSALPSPNILLQQSVNLSCFSASSSTEHIGIPSYCDWSTRWWCWALSALSERMGEEILASLFSWKNLKVEKIFSSTSYWWRDRNIKRYTGLGNYHPE